jgi:hypothetical protein
MITQSFQDNVNALLHLISPHIQSSFVNGDL